MNSSLIHADIFFYITSVAVVILTILLIILFYYLVKIARHLECTARRLKEEGDRIIDDVSMVRESIEEQGGKALSFLRFIFGAFIHTRDSSKRPSRESSRAGKKSRNSEKSK